MKCKICGKELTDQGCYKIGCDNGCTEPMEEGFFEDEDEE